MNSVLFVTVLIVSFIVVRIGAIALQLTGLEWSLAKFQALSCFTATGFTTREAELITSDPRRRRIASVLIVLGHAGLVTMIATFANSLRPLASAERVSLPLLPFTVPVRFVPVLNLTLIAAVIYLVYRLFTNTAFAQKLTSMLRRRMVKRDLVKSLSCEELLIATGGYGVTRIRVRDDHPILNKALSESELRKADITIMAIVRSHETMPNPPASAKILAGDELICFGKLADIRRKLA